MAVPNGSRELTAVEVAAVLRSAASQAKKVVTPRAAWPQRDLPPFVGELPIIFLVVVVGGVNAAETTYSAMGSGLDAFPAKLKADIICTSVAG